jgi:DNA-binding transcriptional regulator YhcF (GntR family)
MKYSRFSKVSKRFTKCPNELLYSPVLNSIEKVLILYIASMPTCFASHQKMAQIAGVSASSIQRALKRLKARNIVNWNRRIGDSCIYSIAHKEKWDMEMRGEDMSDSIIPQSDRVDPQSA